MNTAAQVISTENFKTAYKFKIQSMIWHIETNHCIFGIFLRIAINS